MGPAVQQRRRRLAKTGSRCWGPIALGRSAERDFCCAPKITASLGHVFHRRPLRTIFFRAIPFADQKNGWIAGAKGVIFSTRDGGDNWNREASPVQGMLADIAVTSSRVFITGDSSRLLVLQRQ